MPDFAVLQVRNQSVITLNAIYAKWMLFLFALFMVVGNFFRLFPINPFGNHLSIIEVLLYSSALPGYFTRFRKSFVLLLVIACSSLYGAILHGFDLMSTFYSCKLIGMIMAGIVLGEFLSKEFLLRVFTYVLLVGGIIFFVFPKAHLFFQFLEGYGVQFIGDPHERRFISPFFDPNYYGAIACIPLILSYHLKKKGLFFLFLTSILLTFSRSGIATCFLLLLGFLLIHRWQLRFNWKVFFVFLGSVGLVVFFLEDFAHLFQRTRDLFEDESALARFTSFETGFSYLLERPFFGVGYNYVSHLFIEDLQGHMLDSSMLITLINFGLLPTVGFLAYGCYWLIKNFQRGFIAWLYIYLLICILFTSQFNHLLYFPYWLIPMIGLFGEK